MPKLVHATPSYRHHKPSGQAVVTLDGKDHYLGPWQSKPSKGKYHRLVGEWLAAGRRLPSEPTAPDISIVELLSLYLRHARQHYVKDGRETHEVAGIRSAIRQVRELYGSCNAIDFGPVALKAVRQQMIDSGLSRGVINQHVGRIRRIFRWAVGEQHLPVTVYQALCTIQGLQRGRSNARETKPIGPVQEDIVKATLAHISPIVADMLLVQRFTGTRPAEVCIIRPRDLDRSAEVWIYRPASHKTEHHGRDRVIHVGPKAQEILRPYLLRDADAYCFSPAESERLRNAEKKAARQSPMTPSQAARKPKRGRERPPGERYTPASYRRAINRACDLAFPAPEELSDEYRRKWRQKHRWSPNRLRHSAATEIRQQFGIEGAQVVLGHSRADVTQVYAERDEGLSAKIMAAIG